MGDKKSTSFENKYTVEDLRIMQSWSLQRKIQVTQTRIIEWYQKNNGKVYVSFSGGKDSGFSLNPPDLQGNFVRKRSRVSRLKYSFSWKFSI